MGLIGKLWWIARAAIVLLAVQFAPVSADAHLGHAQEAQLRDHVSHHHVQHSASVLKSDLALAAAKIAHTASQSAQLAAGRVLENQGTRQPADDIATCACCGAGTTCCGFVALADPVSLDPVAQHRRVDVRRAIPIAGLSPEGLRKPPRTIV